MLLFKYSMIYFASLITCCISLMLFESTADSYRSSGAIGIGQMSTSDFVTLVTVFAVSSLIGIFVIGAAAAKSKGVSGLYDPYAPKDYLILYFGTFVSGFFLFVAILLFVAVFIWIVRGIRISDLNRR